MPKPGLDPAVVVPGLCIDENGERIEDNVSLQQMLDEQLDLIQKALTFNQAISKKASSDRLLALASSAREQSNSPKRRAEKASRDPSKSSAHEQVQGQSARSTVRSSSKGNSLTEPLLSSADTDLPSFGGSRTGGFETAKTQRLALLLETLQQNHQYGGALRSRAHGIRSRCRAAASRLLPSKHESETAEMAEAAAEAQPQTNEKTQEGKLRAAEKSRLRKRKIDDMLREDDYDVEDLYSDTGMWQEVARSTSFKNATFAMVILSTIWLAVDTDYNKASVLCNAPLVFQLVDNLFCIYFLVELVVRLLAFRSFRDALSDSGIRFDSFLVLCMITDTWLMVILYLAFGDDMLLGKGGHLIQALRVIRLLRITRALRMSRLFRAVPELLVLVNGMVLAVRSVLTTLGMLVLVTYTFAIVMTQLYSDIPELGGKFGSVPASTNWLLLQVLCGWDAETFQTFLHVGSVSGYILLMLYLLTASLTVMNMLVGILVDVVGTTANEQDEFNKRKELKSNIAELIDMADRDGDHTVTGDEFFAMLRDQRAIKKLYDGGVNVHALADFADFFFRDVDVMALDEFVDTVLTFRGANQATGKDFVDLKVHMSNELARLNRDGESRREVPDEGA